ncbi:heparinase II/III domain-containing protein [Microvirga puerhi]|uniref:Heparinase II/III-family protein n=1 Tax=Microvirga puerhi TaxID=2876078 RepID=A0ABS7VUT4_9HYPH|nr:heparinase II/III family protein [Microvirga puerhi]MBZ6079331.1 heparinase II/III-family protein [Microvirga puerhi]
MEFSASMLGVRQILPTSVQHAGDSEPGPTEGQHIVATKNRWSRVILKFQNVSQDVWCELGFEIEPHAEERAKELNDIAIVGVDFQMEDGSSIDFAYVPGLARAQIDPFVHRLNVSRTDGNATPFGRTRSISCNFLVPAPAKQVQITIRSSHNSHPFTIKNPSLTQFVQPGADAIVSEMLLAPSREEQNATPDARRSWQILSPEPYWFSCDLVPEHSLFVRGQIVTEDDTHDGALARVLFRGEDGQDIPPPYPEMTMAPGIGAFIGVPTHTRARRFTLELSPPSGAKTVDLGFCSWRDASRMELAMPLEISLGYDLLLENIEVHAELGSPDFIDRVLERLKISVASKTGTTSQLLDTWFKHDAPSSVPGSLGRIRDLQQRAKDRLATEELHLGSFPGWSIPETFTWNEDPFRSPAWRMRYHALSWLIELAELADPEALKRAIGLALAWARANPIGSPQDELGFHPTVTAQRTEALLNLLAHAIRPEARVEPQQRTALFGEVIRHGFALAEMVGQSTFFRTISQLHAASALFTLATALGNFPLVPYWRSLAIAKFREGFDDLIGPGGEFIEQSFHNRLEIVSLGLILSEGIKNEPQALALKQHLMPRLREAILELIALTDPGGLLPAFGESPVTLRHASWIRKLISGYGKAWSKDKSIRSELAYPQGHRVLEFPRSGLVASRYYRQGEPWGYFCTTLSEQNAFQEHQEATSFVFASAGRRWIADTGGMATSEDRSTSDYVRSSRAHNVAYLNGRTPTAGTAWLSTRTQINGVQVLEIGSNVHGPGILHRRIFLVPDRLGAIAIIDRFEAPGEQNSFEGYLHFEPEVMAAIASPQLAIGFQARHRLRIVPHAVAGQASGLELIHGRRTPPMQGFILREQGLRQSTNVLRYEFSGGRNVCGGVVIALDETSYRTLRDALQTPAISELLHSS